jgi:hypothetical protein
MAAQTPGTTDGRVSRVWLPCYPEGSHGILSNQRTAGYLWVSYVRPDLSPFGFAPFRLLKTLCPLTTCRSLTALWTLQRTRCFGRRPTRRGGANPHQADCARDRFAVWALRTSHHLGAERIARAGQDISGSADEDATRAPDAFGGTGQAAC